ncbi:hypothetical protein AMTRI_Chr12g268010 [Amborella trichopoda]|uniref:Uncharacterized protein n=1 Tax=Amborella trichopoda TaxID=13333 RepID=W1PD31_AMBTC|nr:hypothetical protein AMTR_s00007p00264290 [Amborella trichopoda]
MGLIGCKVHRILSRLRGRRRRAGLAPKGYVPVFVGRNEKKKFMVWATSLSHVVFLELLCLSTEEYGFSHQGVLQIPCDVTHFEKWVLPSLHKSNVYHPLNKSFPCNDFT